VLPTGDISTVQLKPVDKSYSRPRLPPPDCPKKEAKSISNGRSNESINSLDEPRKQFNESPSNFGDLVSEMDFSKLEFDSSGTLDNSTNVHSNSSYLTDASPASSKSSGVTTQPVNFVSVLLS
jgi:hypothetical protein